MTPKKLTPENYREVFAEMRARRDEEIRRLYASYKADPITGWTLERIAEKYGITKQRVHQIVTETQDDSPD